HALKGTGYSLDIDVDRMHTIEEMLNDLMQDYAWNPVTTTADARVVSFPMPGGAIGPNVHMMVKSGLMDKYSDVLSEFPVVVRAGGAWTSVTPGSQQYWVQAFNNVLYGRWEKIEAGYGRAVLGYFGRPPLPPDPEVVDKAAKQLNLPPYEGDDPFEAVSDPIPEAKKALEENNLSLSEENIFMVVSAMVGGKKMATNEGLKFLLGKGRLDLPLKQEEQAPEAAEPVKAAEPSLPAGPVTTRCKVQEGGKTRTFEVTVEPVAKGASPASSAAREPAQPQEQTSGSGEDVQICSTFAGSVQLTDILVSVGDSVEQGQPVAQVEAMKATHDILAPVSGKITAIKPSIGDEVDPSIPIVICQTRD
ncbi:MAG: biotin/lipoyl-containing protein, partial [Thermodesulfobacteriota bacterium]